MDAACLPLPCYRRWQARHLLNRGCDKAGIPQREGVMDSDDGWIRHRFAPGEEPTVYTTDICADVGHEHCKGIDRTIEGYEGEAVFCVCWCHRFVALEPN